MLGAYSNRVHIPSVNSSLLRCSFHNMETDSIIQKLVYFYRYMHTKDMSIKYLYKYYSLTEFKTVFHILIF